MTKTNILELGRSHFSRLTEAQCTRMYYACLDILERTGVRLYEEKAVDLLRGAGGKVDDGNLVHISAPLVEEALAKAPRRVMLYDRKGEPVIPVEGSRSYFGPGSDCLHIVDHRTWQRRDPVLNDVVEGTILCDALEHVDFVMSMFLPADVNRETADRYQMETMLNHTTKPIVFVTYDMSGCVDAVKMAEAVAGGPEALAPRPFVACYINVTTGLRHNQEALQKLLYLAEKGIPSVYVPGAMAGAAAPVTVAGSNAIRIAGALVGLVIAQLKREGAPVIVPGWGALALDMRTTVQSYTGPDHQGVTQAVSHHFNLPMFGEAGVTDAKAVDQQAGIEAALTLLFDAIAGSQIVHDIGYLESGLSGSLAQIVICDEIIGWIKRALSPVEISEETLGLDLIDEVGPDGQFLDTDHTLQHFHEQWHPGLFERDDYQGWVEKGRRTLAERAAERVDQILAKHKPEPLSELAAVAVRAIVEAAAK